MVCRPVLLKGEVPIAEQRSFLPGNRGRLENDISRALILGSKLIGLHGRSVAALVSDVLNDASPPIGQADCVAARHASSAVSLLRARVTSVRGVNSVIESVRSWRVELLLLVTTRVSVSALRLNELPWWTGRVDLTQVGVSVKAASTVEVSARHTGRRRSERLVSCSGWLLKIDLTGICSWNEELGERSVSAADSDQRNETELRPEQKVNRRV